MTHRRRIEQLESKSPAPEPRPSVDMSRLSDRALREIAAQGDQTELDLTRLSTETLLELRDACPEP